MGYWISVQVRTIMSRVMHKSKYRIGKIIRRVLMIPCEMFLKDHLRNTRSIALLDSVRVRIGGLRDEI